jgi:hypothetical protein
VRSVPSIRCAVVIFVAANAFLAWFVHREYRSLVEYCKDSPEVQQGGDRFSCLEPPNWFAINVALLFLLLLEIALVTVVGAAVVHSWGKRRPTPEIQ